MIRFTDRAREVLLAAERAAQRFDPNARVRLRRTDGGEVAFDLADQSGPHDEVVDGDGFEVIVERGIQGTVDAGEHGVLTLEPDA